MLGSHRLVDERLVLVHIRLRVPPPGGRSHACVRLSGRGDPSAGRPSLGWSRWSSWSPRLRSRVRTVPLEWMCRQMALILSGHRSDARARASRGSARGASGQASRDRLEAGPVVLGPTLSSITITVPVRPWACATSRAGSFTSAIETVSTPRSIAAPANPWSANTRSGGSLLEHPGHRVPAVGVPRAGLVGEHRDAVEVPDLPGWGRSSSCHAARRRA